MSAVSGSHILQEINTTLANNGLHWIGVPVGVSNPTDSRSEILSSIGKGPLARIHFKKFHNVSMSVNTIIPKTVAAHELSGAKLENFDLFEYYKNQLDPNSYVILSQSNRAILRQFNIRFVPNAPITGSFTSEILEPSDTIQDLITEINTPEGEGNGTQLEVYKNLELSVLFGGQFFRGVNAAEISASVELQPIKTIGGIYGYIIGQPFQVDVSIETYEKHFAEYQEFFNDVNELKDMKIGPFTVTRVKMMSHSTSVDAGSYKKINVQLKGKNITFQK